MPRWMTLASGRSRDDGSQRSGRDRVVATESAGYSFALTRWSVPRMSVAFTTVRAASARSRSVIANLARRDQSPMYGAGAHWACSPARRSIAAAGESAARFSRSCRARSARFSSRSERTRGVATAQTLREPANDPNHFSLDLHVPGVDRLHLAVGGLQPDAIALLVEAL